VVPLTGANIREELLGGAREETDRKTVATVDWARAGTRTVGISSLS
jgi:hypothetical protein